MIDAGLSNRTVESTFDACSMILGQDDPSVSVMHTTTCKTMIGGRVLDTVHDRTVYFASKVQRCAKSLLAMRTHRVGNLPVQQFEGIHIGRHISGCFMDLVLSKTIHTFGCFSQSKLKQSLASSDVEANTSMISSLCPDVLVCNVFNTSSR